MFILYIVLASALVLVSPPCILLLYFDILLYILITDTNFTFPRKKKKEYRQTIETRGINKEEFTLKDILLKYQEKFKAKEGE